MDFKVSDIWDDFYDYKTIKKPSAPNFKIFSSNACHSACFSGYREEKFKFAFNPMNSRYMELENKLRDTVINTINLNFKSFYCGMCYGFDIMAGELILEQKALGKNIELIAVIPFKDQAKTFSKHWRKRYYNLLKAADKVVILQPKYTSGCYERRNQYMANRSSLLICYYDTGSGGTKNMIDYSRSTGLDVINLNDLLDK